jgi:hypothetical protein
MNITSYGLSYVEYIFCYECYRAGDRGDSKACLCLPAVYKKYQNDLRTD